MVESSSCNMVDVNLQRQIVVNHDAEVTDRRSRLDGYPSDVEFTNQAVLQPPYETRHHLVGNEVYKNSKKQICPKDGNGKSEKEKSNCEATGMFWVDPKTVFLKIYGWLAKIKFMAAVWRWQFG